MINILDCQILSLGYEYRLIDCDLEDYRCVAFLSLNKDGRGGGGGEFAVLLNYANALFVLTSAEMKWKRLENVPSAPCWDVGTFRGKFYASFSRVISVIDPYSLDVTLLMPSQPLNLIHSLIPSGNDELFLVERITSLLSYRVSRLDEEAGKWVEVTDLGDRVLFINRRHLGNVCCSAKELPDGCGVSGNSIVIMTGEPGKVTFFYKYGVRVEAGLKCWRLLIDKRVTILSRSPVVAFRVDHPML